MKTSQNILPAKRKIKVKKLVDGLNDCTNSEYHADRNYLSSSVLKTVLKSLDTYYLEYILGEKKEISSTLQATFDLGSLVHSMILEPHLTNNEFQYFKGFRKSGKEYEDFLSSARAGVPIISSPQKHKADELMKAYKRNQAAVGLIKNGEAEQTICGELHGVPIKTRFDYINVEAGYIVDVKTTGYASNLESFRMSFDTLQYNLSAALYLDMAEKFYGKKFDFYMLVLSKKDITCDVFKLSQDTINSGKRLVLEACQKYIKAKSTNVWTEITERDKLQAVTDYEIKEL